MTVDKPTVMLEILDEDPTLRVYQYRHRQTGDLLYALFPPWQADDMAWAPDVTEAVLLWETGDWTEAGTDWLAQHLAPPENPHA